MRLTQIFDVLFAMACCLGLAACVVGVFEIDPWKIPPISGAIACFYSLMRPVR